MIRAAYHPDNPLLERTAAAYTSLAVGSRARAAAAAQRPYVITLAKLRAGYDRIGPDDYDMPLTDDDFEYTWAWFQGVVEFYQRAAAAGRNHHEPP